MRAIALALLLAAACAGTAVAVPPAELVREQRAIADALATRLPLYCAAGTKREIALTFDDGPSPYTAQLLDELRRAHVSATFFVIGREIPGFGPVVKAEARLGVVGEHTQDHITLTAVPRRRARAEIARGRAAAESAGGSVVQLLRPPGGHRTRAIDALARSYGLLDVLWTVDPRDWALTRRKAVVRAVESDPRLVPGAIVLLHDSRLSTVRAVPTILAWLRHRHLSPVTIPRLLADDPPTAAELSLDARAASCVHLFRSAR